MGILGEAQQEQLHHLYSEHHGWLLSWLRKKLGCGHHAADVAQDTFMRILSAPQALFGMSTPRAYLVTTARHLMADRAKRDAIEQAYLAELTLWCENDQFAITPEESAVALQTLMLLGQALENLSERARQAFLLHFFDGETHAAIAATLGVSTKSVQKYLAQSLVACHQVLAA